VAPGDRAARADLGSGAEHGWTGDANGGSDAGYLAAKYRCEDQTPVIVHRGGELAYCGDMGDYDDREHTHGLWALDYPHGKATNVYPLAHEPELLLPKSDDVAALGTRDELGVIGAAGWTTPLAKLDFDRGKFQVSALAWLGDQVHVLVVHADGRPDDPPPHPTARELVVGAPELTADHDFPSVVYPSRIARYTDGQWWVLVNDDAKPRWLGVDHGEQPLGAGHGWASGWQTQNLAAGVFSEFPDATVDGDKVVELPASKHTPHRFVWDGATLRRADSKAINDDTDQVTVGGNPVELHWRKGGRDLYEVAVGDAGNVVALLPAFRGGEGHVSLALSAAAGGGYYLTDGMGRYATLDAAFHRTDDWDIWDYVRSSAPDEDRRTMPVIWPENWHVRGLAFALFGLPVIGVLVIGLAFVRRRPGGGLALASAWTLVLLAVYAIGAVAGLAAVLPRL
jgi:hypothetical protein